MAYDKELIQSWLESDDWGAHLEKHGALGNNVSTARFKTIEKQYFDEVKRRIAYCSKLVIYYQDAFIYYAIARLFSRADLNESANQLYMQEVRCYCYKSIRKDPYFAPCWALWAEAYAWIANLGCESKVMPGFHIYFDKANTKRVEKYIDFNVCLSKTQKIRINYIDKAIRCIQRAIKLDSMNKEYQCLLKSYYGHRNEYFR